MAFRDALRARWNHADRWDRWLALPSILAVWIALLGQWIGIGPAVAWWWVVGIAGVAFAVWIVQTFIWLESVKRQLQRMSHQLGEYPQCTADEPPCGECREGHA